MRGHRWFPLVLLLVTGLAWAQAPGTEYPSQKLIFPDPLTGQTIHRLTVSSAGSHAAPSDQSSEASAWHPDNRSITYAKTGVPSRTDGVYRMDTDSGKEIYLAPAPWGSAPTWSRDGAEVYYNTRSGSSLVVKAVRATSPYTVRTVVTVTGTQWQEKITVNADGSLISVHPKMNNGSYRNVILNPATGAILPQWQPSSSVTGDDGVVWSPTDPKRVCAKRGSEAKAFHVDTLEALKGGCWPAHSAWHPGQPWFFTPAYLTDLVTGQVTGTGAYSPHPNFAPSDGALGMEARLVLDESRSMFNNSGRPRLYICTLTQVFQRPGDWRQPACLAATHYSSYGSNSAHPHPTFSRNAQRLLWMTDLKDTRDGAPPGGIGNSVDLFMLVLVEAPQPPPPVTGLTGSQEAVALTWTASPGATGYQIERSIDGGAWAPYGDEIAGTALPVVAPKVCYRVIPKNPGGAGPPTEICP